MLDFLEAFVPIYFVLPTGTAHVLTKAEWWNSGLWRYSSYAANINDIMAQNGL